MKLPQEPLTFNNPSGKSLAARPEIAAYFNLIDYDKGTVESQSNRCKRQLLAKAYSLQRNEFDQPTEIPQEKIGKRTTTRQAIRRGKSIMVVSKVIKAGLPD